MGNDFIGLLNDSTQSLPEPQHWNRFFSPHEIQKFLFKVKKMYMIVCLQYGNYIDGLVQDSSNSIANALELLQSCAKLSIYCSGLIMLCFFNWPIGSLSLGTGLSTWDEDRTVWINGTKSLRGWMSWWHTVQPLVRFNELDSWHVFKSSKHVSSWYH